MSESDAAGGNLDQRPRVGLVIVDDGLYTHRWVGALLNAPDLEVVCAACLSPFDAVGLNPGGVRGLWRVSWARMRYYGPAATLRFAAKSAVGRAFGLLFRLRLGRQPHCVASAARARAVEVFTPPQGNVNHPEFCARLASHDLDLLVGAFSQRAGPAFLDAARLGCLNVHFSMLPQHRGREPLFQAMLSGQGGGVSVHWMTAEIDAGAVVCQEPLDTAPHTTLHQVILRACDLAALVVPEAVRRAVRWESDKEGPTGLPRLAGWPSREDVARFRKRGFRFV